MRADKKFFSEDELGLYPKITTEDLHTSCQGHVVTTDLPTLGTNPNSKQHGSTTQEARDLGNPRCLGRTVRSDWRTVREGQADDLRVRCTLRNSDGRSAPHGQSDLTRQTVRPTTSNQNLPTQRIETKRLKNSRRTRQTPGRSTPRRRSARHENSSPCPTSQRSTPPPFARSPESTNGLLPNHR
jgi:hypothetical protein